jgi:hypothetical protein
MARPVSRRIISDVEKINSREEKMVNEELKKENEELAGQNEELTEVNEKLMLKNEELDKREEELKIKSEKSKRKDEELKEREEKLKLKAESLKSKEEEEKLKKENENLKNQLIFQMKFAESVNNSTRVDPETYIELISLCPNQLTLSTESKGRGLNYTWNKFGEIRQIVYSDLQKIIQNHGAGLYTDFIREGYVYINNPDVVKKSGLRDVYEHLLTKEQVEEVLLCNSKKCVELFRSTLRRQQLFIGQMLIDKIAAGEVLDLNIVDELSRIVGLEIIKKAEEAKSYLDMNLKAQI